MGSNWGRWGDEDEVGAANLVTPDVVRQALGSAKRGTVLSLAQPLGPSSIPAPHRGRIARFMNRDAGDYEGGARSPNGFRFAEDTIQMPSHSGTHIDALAHVWEGDYLYNGHPASTVRTSRGATRCGAEVLRPIATRGVVIDLALEFGPLHRGEGIEADDLEACCVRQSLIIRSGDAVLIRTGWWEQAGGTADYYSGEPGLTISAAEWLAAKDVCIVGADNYAVEQQPSAPGTTFPVHLSLLRQYGVPLLENLDLKAVSSTGEFEFLLILAPVGVQGSTAGLVNPIAVL
ncbi:MAG: Kynurenine formamidase [Nitrospira sp.]|nr:Kynurenine formamidase [Nitrospira sp.]